MRVIRFWISIWQLAISKNSAYLKKTSVHTLKFKYFESPNFGSHERSSDEMRRYSLWRRSAIHNYRTYLWWIYDAGLPEKKFSPSGAQFVAALPYFTRNLFKINENIGKMLRNPTQWYFLLDGDFAGVVFSESDKKFEVWDLRSLWESCTVTHQKWDKPSKWDTLTKKDSIPQKFGFWNHLYQKCIANQSQWKLPKWHFSWKEKWPWYSEERATGGCKWRLSGFDPIV